MYFNNECRQGGGFSVSGRDTWHNIQRVPTMCSMPNTMINTPTSAHLLFKCLVTRRDSDNCARRKQTIPTDKRHVWDTDHIFPGLIPSLPYFD